MKVLTEKEIDDIRSEAKAEALREAAERAVDFCSSWNINSDWLRAAILADEPQVECTWTEYPEGYWSTSCGRSWTFIEGGPEENGICYCHGCGKPVRITDEPDKEE